MIRITTCMLCNIQLSANGTIALRVVVENHFSTTHPSEWSNFQTTKKEVTAVVMQEKKRLKAIADTYLMDGYLMMPYTGSL